MKVFNANPPQDVSEYKGMAAGCITDFIDIVKKS